MPAIGIAYSGSAGAFNIVITNFGGNQFPRSYQESATFSQSANGASILAGPAFKQKYQWAISTIMLKADAEILQDMFESWDKDRSAGLAAAVGIVDETGPGADVSTNAIFATPPTFTRMGPLQLMVSFGLMEV